MLNKIRIFSVYLFVFSFLYSGIYGQEVSEINSNEIVIKTNELPVLNKLSSYETDFKEYSKIVERNYKLIFAGKNPDIRFYKYTNSENYTLQGLASRCNINYDTLATLNQIESSGTNIKGKTLIIPTVQGLFINQKKGKNSIEILLQENKSLENSTRPTFYISIDNNNFVFKQGLRFSSTERAYFLDSALGLPLAPATYWISSEFGQRKNPFSGQLKNHNGIDLAADDGTPVFAIKDGAVAYAIADDPEFGNYIILQHDSGKMTSVYAHLSELYVDQYQTVKKGDIIGLVGHSGMATGSHLHFEIRVGGKAEDPRTKIKLD